MASAGSSPSSSPSTPEGGADVWPVVAAERRALADQLAALRPDQWSSPSLCDGWTVRHVAAHLTAPVAVSLPRFALAMARARGDFAAANDAVTQRLAARPTAQIVADLRRAADSRWTPPGRGPEAPLTDVLVHGKDIRVPLGLPDDRPGGPWAEVLRFATSKGARGAVVPTGLPPLRLVAADVDLTVPTVPTAGDAPEVRGTACDLALAVMGRAVHLDALAGPGAGALRSWALGEHRG